MKKIAILLGMLLITAYGYSQEKQNVEQLVGINAGFSTGYGFSYKAVFRKIALQATVLPIKSDETKYISLGATAFYMLRHEKRFKTFTYLGNHYVSTYKDAEDNIGFGWGLTLGNKVQFSAMAGYAVYDAFDSFGLLPTLETSLFFKL